MNTLGEHIPVIMGPFGEQEIILERYEFNFPKWQLQTIADLHNDGTHIYEIAKIVKRKDIEVLLAIIHLADKRKISRPLAYWNRGETNETRVV